MSEYEYSTVTISCQHCGKNNTIVGSIPEFEIVNCSSCSTPLGQLRQLVADTMTETQGSGIAAESAAT
jgi:predicted nucleic acid-binding Zn ribbon protein